MSRFPNIKTPKNTPVKITTAERHKRMLPIIRSSLERGKTFTQISNELGYSTATLRKIRKTENIDAVLKANKDKKESRLRIKNAATKILGRMK